MTTRNRAYQRRRQRKRALVTFDMETCLVAADFSDIEMRMLYRDEVDKRVIEFGMTRDRAEMLVAVLMRK